MSYHFLKSSFSGLTRVFVFLFITIPYAQSFQYAYVVNYTDKNISVISLDDKKMINVIDAGLEPYKIILSPDKKKGYVMDRKAPHVTIIDFETDRIVGQLDTRKPPLSAAFIDQGQHLYIPDPDSSNAVVMSLKLKTPLEDPMAAGEAPTDVLLSKDGKFLYTLSKRAQTFSIIDIKEKKIIASIKVGKLPVAMAVTEDGKHAYVIGQEARIVDIIDIEEKEKSKNPLFVGKLPQSIVLSSKRKRGYVVNTGDNTVTVIDLEKNRQVGKPIPVGLEPYGIALDSNEQYAYVTNSQGYTLTKIDLATNTASRDQILTGKFPADIVILDFAKKKPVLIEFKGYIPPKVTYSTDIGCGRSAKTKPANKIAGFPQVPPLQQNMPQPKNGCNSCLSD